MTFKRLQRIMQDIRPRPGWRVRAERVFRGPADVLITVAARVKDSGGHGYVEVGRVEFLGPERLKHLDERGALRLVLRLLDEAEAHETREWFRYKGTRPFDPHR